MNFITWDHRAHCLPLTAGEQCQDEQLQTGDRAIDEEAMASVSRFCHAGWRWQIYDSYCDNLAGIRDMGTQLTNYTWYVA